MKNSSMVQGELDLDSTLEMDGGNGYDVWHEALREKYRKIADTWRLPLHQKVVVKLKWRPDELTGPLVLQELPEQFSSRLPLKLRVGACDFDSTEIEYCKRARQDGGRSQPAAIF